MRFSFNRTLIINKIGCRSLFGFSLLCVSIVLLQGCWFFEPTDGSAGMTDQPIAVDETNPSITPAYSDDPAEMYLDEAITFLNEGNKEAALDSFAAAIAVNPRLYRAHMGMGDIYREKGVYVYAEQAYEQAVESNPKSYEANYFWGLMLHQLNRITEAIRAYRQALVIDPNSHEANLNIATAYIQLNKPAEALPFGLRAGQLQPEHGPTHANLGVIYAAIESHNKAIDEYQKALELMEPMPELILNLVESLRHVDRYAEMINALDALIRMEPSPAAYERLGFAYFKLQRYNDSMDGYRQAIEMDPDYYPAMNGLAVNLLNQYIRSNRADTDAQAEAIDMLRHSLRLERDQPRIVDLLSRYGR